jgi:hypothetical protein
MEDSNEDLKVTADTLPRGLESATNLGFLGARAGRDFSNPASGKHGCRRKYQGRHLQARDLRFGLTFCAFAPRCRVSWEKDSQKEGHVQTTRACLQRLFSFYSIPCAITNTSTQVRKSPNHTETPLPEPALRTVYPSSSQRSSQGNSSKNIQSFTEMGSAHRISSPRRHGGVGS